MVGVAWERVFSVNEVGRKLELGVVMRKRIQREKLNDFGHCDVDIESNRNEINFNDFFFS